MIDVLRQPIAEDWVQIRYDGIIYLPGEKRIEILTQAFGPGGWALVDDSQPILQHNMMMVRGVLVCHGVPITRVIGGHPWHPNNQRMTYVDAYESARTDAISKACKPLGIARELRDVDWRDAWKAKWAEQVWDANRNQRVWRRKGTELAPGQGKEGRVDASEYTRPPRVEDENNAHLEAIARERPLRTRRKEMDDTLDTWAARGEREPGEEG